MLLINGTKYHANIEIGWPKSAFASISKVQAFFTDYGFTGVDAVGSGGCYSVIGTWGKPDSDVTLPSQIKFVEAV